MHDSCASTARRLSVPDLMFAIDTATSRIGIGLSSAADILAESVWHTDRYHTVELAPRAALMMRETGTTPDDLTGLAVASGPGSYTGLRIGMAFAKGLALAHRIPLIGVPTLDSLARMQPQRDMPMLAALQAGRGRIAAAWYRWRRSGWEADGDPFTAGWQHILEGLDGPIYVCGEIDAQARTVLERHQLVELASPAMSLRRPSYLAEMAREQLAPGRIPDAASLAPTYLGEV